jgi:UDP-3-O-[3-hydroxymyristoyl] glucosamine N-acyltransferase
VTQPTGSLRLATLAAELGREWVGDGEFLIEGVAPLESAGECELSYVRSSSWAAAGARSRAGALILPEGSDAGGRPAIPSPNPALDFARAVRRIRPPSRPAPGTSSAAWIDPEASVDPSASVGPGVAVGAGSRVGARTILHANVTVYRGVEIGEDCELHAGVVVREDTVMGNRVCLEPGVVIGGDGFGYVHDEGGRFEKVPQVGRVVIEDDVEIGAGSTVDRATLSETRIRRGAKIDNLVQIAHNCDVGEGAVIAGQTGLSGSTVVGPGAIIMAQVGSAGHLRVGARAFVGARAGLHRDVPEGARVWGSPQMEERAWHRAVAALARLPGALRRLRAVERKLGLRGDADPTSREREPGAPGEGAAPRRSGVRGRSSGGGGS